MTPGSNLTDVTAASSWNGDVFVQVSGTYF